MFEIEKPNDARLIGKAIEKGWNVDREAVIATLLRALQSPDEEISIEAASVLLRADMLNIKREELELKRQAQDDEKRLRLLEIARHLPVGELAKLASANGCVAGDAGYAIETSGVDGEEAGS